MTADLSNAVLAFGVDLYKQLTINAGKNARNVVASPFSIATSLSMTLAGARGHTATEIENSLHTKNSEDIHSHFCNFLTQLLGCAPEVTLQIANRLYCEKAFNVLEEHTSVLKKFYGSAVIPASFKTEPEEARLTINAWVEEATKSKIKNVLPGSIIDSDTVLVLVNAIYSKGTWKNQFDILATSPGNFHVSKGKVKTVDMMHNEARYRVCKCDDLKAGAIELPYKGGKASMLILLPDDVEGLADLEVSLTATKLEDVMAALQGPAKSANLSLPRFKVEQATDLKTTLHCMGIKDLFSDGADLSGINGNKELVISAAIHKAFVEVSEEGTEAAAATIMAASNSCARFATNFTVDHPFMFLIRWHDPSIILFMGSVRDIIT
ncbi:ipis-1-like isoform X1 [Dermacentor albipictus]|uniref:ipis-1-like isoform X1 n=2 Tax=Dermacentor albipictus TaxID=60249 RepID=UPI0031FC7CD1